MRPNTTLTVEYTVTVELDGVTANDPIPLAPATMAATPSGIDQIYRRTVERLGIFNPSLFSGEHGSIGIRGVEAIFIDGPAPPAAGASVDLVAIPADGSIRLQSPVFALEQARTYAPIGSLVGRGSALRLSGMAAGAAPIIVRFSMLVPQSVTEALQLIALHTAA